MSADSCRCRAPELADEWGLTAAETAWLATAVRLGFVAGAARATVVAAAVASAGPAIAPRFPTDVALGGVRRGRGAWRAGSRTAAGSLSAC